MNRQILVLFLGLVALLPAPVAALAQEGAAPASSSLGQGEPILTAESVAELSPDVQRALVYMIGTPRVFQKMQALLIQAEIDRRKEAGLELGYAQVTDFDVEKRVDQLMADFVEQNPDLDFWGQVSAAGYDEAGYRAEIRENLQLERLYFPPNTDDWPTDILKEVFGGEEDEQSMWNTMISKMPEELAKQKAQGLPGEINALTMKLFLRPHIFSYLMDNTEIKFPFDGLPAGVCLRVGGIDVKTAELIEGFAPIVSDVELQRAQQWVSICAALRADLQEKGVLLSSEQVMDIIAEEEKEYEGSVITYQQIVLEFMGFPSMELYHEYKLLRESFRKTLPAEFSEATLDAHLAKRLRFIGQGQASVEAILIAARDLDTGTWPRRGSWEAARKRSEVVTRELLERADGGVSDEEWGEVLDQYSEYPMRTRGSAQNMPQPQRGRFGSILRNPLRQFIGENDYTDFLIGCNIADHAFFEAEPGAIYGPVEGVHGFYIYKLINRSEPTQQVDWRNNERQAYFVRDDYLNVVFNDYVNGLLSR